MRRFLSRSIFVLSLWIGADLLTQGSETWIVVNPRPTAAPLAAVVWTGSKIVAAGGQGAVVSSTDGVMWEGCRITDPDGDFVEISQMATSGRQIVAAGNVPGVVWTSNDGAHWDRVALGFPAEIRRLIWTGTQFSGIAIKIETVTGGSRAHYLFVSSLDGVHWKSDPITISGRVKLSDLAWTGQRYILVGSRKTDWNDWRDYFAFILTYRPANTPLETFAATSTDGRAWTREVLEDSPKAEPPTVVVWTGSQAVIVGGAGSVLTSRDGESWSHTSSIGKLDGTLFELRWTGREIAGVIIPDDRKAPSEIIVSQDGAAWTVHKLGYTEANQPSALAWTGSQYVVVGGSGLIQTSPDLVTWTSRSPVGYTAQTLLKIASSGSKLVAVGHNTLLTSADGEHWSLAAPTDFDAQSIAWTGARFVTVGKDGKMFLSPDAVQWREQDIEGEPWLEDVAFSGGVTVAVGSGKNGSPPEIFFSSDGTTWTQDTLPDGLLGRLCGVAWTGTTFVAVGDDGAILTSADGRSWTKVHGEDYDPLLYAVASSGKQCVAVGVNVDGKPDGLMSTDGVHWSGITLGPARNLRGVAWCGGRFVVVGELASIFISHDGMNWVRDSTPLNVDFMSAVGSGGKIFVVGDGGSVLEATP
jgi:hypothetical protein